MTTASSSRRQVLLLITDTTRWDMLNCYRETGISTPALDSLAAQGCRFDRAYTCSPVCAPARSALLTGTWPHSNGVWGNDMPLGQGIATIGERLNRAGTSCGYIGKWHLDGSDYFGDGICPAGWDDDYWYDGRRHLEAMSDADRERSRDPRSNLHGVPSEFTYAHQCADRALQYLETHHAQDFLLVVSFDEPHGPSLCPPEYIEPYLDFHFPSSLNTTDTLVDKPEHQRVWAEGFPDELVASSQDRAPFFGSQSYVDSQIGRLLQAVDSLVPDALVIYTSDHGDALTSHRLTHKGPAMYDEVARIPLLVRCTGRIPAGTVHSNPVSHIDVAPTVLEFLGAPPPEVMEGGSLMTGLSHPADDWGRPVFVEFGRYEVDHDGFGGFQPMRGVIDGHLKLVVNLLSEDELYDVEADPAELQNLLNDPAHSQNRDRLHDLLLEWMHETRDPFRGYQWERRPWRHDATPPRWAGREMTRQPKSDPRRPVPLDYDTGLPFTQRERRKAAPRNPR